MKAWWTAAELAGLPGMPGTERAIQLRAKREGWHSRVREDVENGRPPLEYHVDSLPRETREHLAAEALAAPTSVPAVAQAAGTPGAAGASPAIDDRGHPVAPSPREESPSSRGPLLFHLKDWQRRTMEARAALAGEVSRLQMTLGLSMSAGVTAVVRAIREGSLAPHLAALVPIANARGGTSGTRTLSRATLIGWCNAHAEGGAAALAPRPARSPDDIPDWAPALMKLYGRPQKPSLAGVLERDLPPVLAGTGIEAPSYEQARRFLARCSTQTRLHGRLGPRAMQAVRAYRARGTENLWPAAVYVPDGHTFDAEVAHPFHGQPFRPEITTIIDAHTRKAAGWSVALAESALAVADAYRHAFTTTGICAIAYSDNGPGETSAMLDDPVTGLLARLGVTHETGRPGNAQGHGIIERLNKTLWVEAAKTLPTYLGADMDDDARKRAYKITRRDIDRVGKSRLLIDWQDFLAMCEAAVAAYNARPHSALPAVWDPETGRKRHMSPNEMWERGVREGCEIDILTPGLAADLFRPEVRRFTRRGLVSWLGNQYFHRALEPLHGEEVAVGYDIHDASKVWVRDFQGRLICEAAWNGNRSDFFPPRTVARAKAEQRAKGRLRLLDGRRAEIEAELNPAVTIEMKPAVTIDPETRARGEAEIVRIETRQAPAPAIPADPDARPTFGDDVAWMRWLADRPDRALPEDRRHLTDKLKEPTFRMLAEVECIDLATLGAIASAAA